MSKLCQCYKVITQAISSGHRKYPSAGLFLWTTKKLKKKGLISILINMTVCIGHNNTTWTFRLIFTARHQLYKTLTLLPGETVTDGGTFVAADSTPVEHL